MWELLDVGLHAPPPCSAVMSAGSSRPTVRADLPFGTYIIKPASHILFCRCQSPPRSVL